MVTNFRPLFVVSNLLFFVVMCSVRRKLSVASLFHVKIETKVRHDIAMVCRDILRMCCDVGFAGIIQRKIEIPQLNTMFDRYIFITHY